MRQLFSALFLHLIFLSSTPVAARDFHFGIGMHVGIGRYDEQTASNTIAASPFTSVRDDLLWSRVQRSDRSFAPSREVQELDKFISATAKQGKKIVLILGYGNSIATRNGLIETPEEIAFFVEYAKWAAQRFADRVEYFEIWNEWSGGMGLERVPHDKRSAEVYINLLKATSEAIRQVAPGAKILSSGIAGLDTKWFTAFINAGGAAYVDGISMHPYVHTYKVGPIPETAIAWMDRMRAFMQKGGIDKPFLVTEIGWPNLRNSRPPISEEMTGDYLFRFVSLARTRPWVKGVWWYELFNGGVSPSNPEMNFGLIALDGRKKPSFFQATLMARLLGNYDQWQDESMSSDFRQIKLSSSSSERNCLAVWAPDAPVSFTITSSDLPFTALQQGEPMQADLKNLSKQATATPLLACTEGKQLAIRRD